MLEIHEGMVALIHSHFQLQSDGKKNCQINVRCVLLIAAFISTLNSRANDPPIKDILFLYVDCWSGNKSGQNEREIKLKTAILTNTAVVKKRIINIQHK